MSRCHGACSAAACPTPLSCSGAVPLVDESIQHFQLHRLQQVSPTRYPFAPGVIEGPDRDDFTCKDNALFALLRLALPYVALIAGVAFAVGFIGRKAGFF